MKLRQLWEEREILVIIILAFTIGALSGEIVKGLTS